MTITSTIETHTHDYSGLLSHVEKSFSSVVLTHGQLFQTSAVGLWETYLEGLPAELRQVHNCHECRRFVETYGSLAFVDDSGNLNSPFWTGGAPEPYTSAFSKMASLIRKAKIESPFYSSQKTWGVPKTGEWRHVYVTPPAGMVHRDPVLSASQKMAAMKERYRVVLDFLGGYRKEHLDTALALMEGEFLKRSEKYIGPLRWLRGLYDSEARGKNIRWVRITEAPEGYCHPKAGVVGELIADIAKGLDMKFVKKNFDSKLDPEKHQRPQAAPTAGNIQQAEKIIEQLGIARSLERRFARIEELQLEWSPKVESPREGGGVFGHLNAKGSEKLNKDLGLSATTLTWSKFAATVLPHAEEIKAQLPMTGNFGAVLTAQHEDAPNILKWDNPFSIYSYIGGTPARQWRVNGLTRVTGISKFPHLWGDKPQVHQGIGVILILQDAVDSFKDAGNALFPEILDSRLHGVRATIEAYSGSAQISGREEASACGLMVVGNSGARLKVLVHGFWTDYTIDRWE